MPAVKRHIWTIPHIPLTKFILLFALYCQMAIGQCQTLISGSVINNQTKQPIPYVNIGIANTEVGTISNEDGSFSIKIPLKYSGQDLLFSSVGYIRKSFPVSSIPTPSNNLMISLNENVLELSEVEIVAKHEKKKSVTLGNGKSLLLSGQLHYDTLSAGSAMALLIDKSDDKNLTFLNEASLYIAKNLSPEFKVRMRIMSVDSQTNKPGVDILTQQALVTSDIKKGWLDFEIEDTQIVKEDKFFLVFEWIMDKDDREYVTSKYEQYMKMYPDRVSFDTVIINHEKVTIPRVSTVVAGTVFGVSKTKKDRELFKCYYRSNSFGEWKTSSGILSAKVTLSNYPSTGESETKKSPCDALACKIDKWATDFQNEYNTPGFQLSIGKTDTIVFSQGYGYADKAANILVDRQTQFRIASISKTMTSAAIMQLHAQGLLDLDTSIQTYVPTFPEKQYPITVRQVASHLSGIRHYYGKSWDEIFIQQHYSNLNDALSIFKNDSLQVKPDTKFLYSSYGYILLGAAIENITQQPYLSYMKQNIWEPIGMHNTFGDIADSVMAHKSKFYYLNGEEATPYDLSYSYSTGGLLSTSDDLTKYGLAITQDYFLGQETKSLIFQDQMTSDRRTVGYGLGWYVEENINNKRIWFHTGELPSSGSILVIFPDQKIVIALLANSPIVSDTQDNFFEDMMQLEKLVESE